MSVVSVVTNASRSAFPMVLVSAVGGLLAGSILSGMEAGLNAVQGLLVMVPAFLAIRGSVYGSLGSRLSSGLHQGLIEPVFELNARLVNVGVAALLNGVTASVGAAVLTYGILSVLGQEVASLWVLVVIAVVGGVLAGIALTGVIFIVVFLGYRQGMNPDDLVGPAMTTAGDIFGMAALFVATKLVLLV